VQAVHSNGSGALVLGWSVFILAKRVSDCVSRACAATIRHLAIQTATIPESAVGQDNHLDLEALDGITRMNRFIAGRPLPAEC
jgi:hypothetical protein